MNQVQNSTTHCQSEPCKHPDTVHPPVAPVAPGTPVAPVTPVSPVTPVAPVAPVAPVTPAQHNIYSHPSCFSFNMSMRVVTDNGLAKPYHRNLSALKRQTVSIDSTNFLCGIFLHMHCCAFPGDWNRRCQTFQTNCWSN